MFIEEYDRWVRISDKKRASELYHRTLSADGPEQCLGLHCRNNRDDDQLFCDHPYVLKGRIPKY